MPDRSHTKGQRRGGRQELTTADLVVLSLLAEKPMHGYDLLSEYQRQEVVDWASVSKAQLYYALTKLSEIKLIEGRGEEGRARERVVYAPTDAGIIALAKALTDTSWASGRIAQPFTTWLGLSIHAEPDSQRNMLMARQKFLIAEIEKERESLTFIETLPGGRAARGSEIVRLVIRQLGVVLEWVGELLEAN